MKQAIKILFLFLALSFTACKPVKYIPIRTNTTVKDREVSVDVPKDSSSIFALLACDSLNQVYFKIIKESKTANVTQQVTLEDNKLNIRFATGKQQVKVIVRDSIVEREIPIPVPGETVTVYKMKWYEEAFMWFGILAASAIIILIIIQLWKIKQRL